MPRLSAQANVVDLFRRNVLHRERAVGGGWGAGASEDVLNDKAIGDPEVNRSMARVLDAKQGALIVGQQAPGFTATRFCGDGGDKAFENRALERIR